MSPSGDPGGDALRDLAKRYGFTVTINAPHPELADTTAHEVEGTSKQNRDIGFLIDHPDRDAAIDAAIIALLALASAGGHR